MTDRATGAWRVGQGFDVHRFSHDAGRPLVLGGVVVDGEGARGLDGHSDADALAHAVADAVLGGAGLGDLGGVAPDSDPRWKDADSLRILAEVVSRARSAGWRPVNADCTVVAERPQLAQFVGEMAGRLGAILGAPVNVKATTAEGMGALGRVEGVACMAVVLLACTDEPHAGEA
ncbi:MAG TPA: 2-C-methyl-D-erythritol 2,4-cyclodiphosphate synthase [Acidimicrobiales bacterium]|nr:2-C-methyl-D-erythritol 2,4-cyclodiphosphate synthase [Acidimicrobiales bacterium]